MVEIGVTPILVEDRDGIGDVIEDVDGLRMHGFQLGGFHVHFLAWEIRFQPLMLPPW